MNRDGNPDLIWQNSATRQVAVWFFSGSTCVSTDYLRDSMQNTIEQDLNWKIVAAGDMNQDGSPDLLWRHRTTGDLRVWHMNGVVQWDSVPLLSPGPQWEIVGLADLNADSFLDLLWRNTGDGSLATWLMRDVRAEAVWFMNGTHLIFRQYLNPATVSDPNWRIVGVK
jgi:hypothetical protein